MYPRFCHGYGTKRSSCSESSVPPSDCSRTSSSNGKLSTFSSSASIRPISLSGGGCRFWSIQGYGCFLPLLHTCEVWSESLLLQVKALSDAPPRPGKEVGKRRGRPLIAAAGTSFPASSTSSSSISILETTSRRFFLVDSGADESVFPATNADRSNNRTSNLIAANGSVIPTYGRRQLPVSFRSGHSSLHWFWIADVSRPILGATYFQEQGLLIDIQNRRLVSQSNPGLTFAAVPSRSTGINGLRLPTSGQFEALLDGFPSLLKPQFTGEVKHNVRHYIQTTGRPLHARPRRLDGEKLRIAREEFLKMEQLGIIRRSDSPWSSPLHVVPLSLIHI